MVNQTKSEFQFYVHMYDIISKPDRNVRGPRQPGGRPGDQWGHCGELRPGKVRVFHLISRSTARPWQTYNWATMAKLALYQKIWAVQPMVWGNWRTSLDIRQSQNIIWDQVIIWLQWAKLISTAIHYYISSICKLFIWHLFAICGRHKDSEIQEI